MTRNLSSPPAMLRACMQAAHKLQAVCEATGYVDRNESEKMAQVWETAHAAQTRTWARDAISSIRTMAKTKTSRSECSRRTEKPVFNHEFTPLLETYFEKNAYPSATDRAILAEKSMMTPRQIEVWFQNHRNRAKKDRKPLHKPSEDQTPLFFPPKHLSPFTQPQRPKSDLTCKDSSPDAPPTKCLADNNPLDPPRPPHAFPSSYPPRCNYDPFPGKLAQVDLPIPVWYRKPAANALTPPSVSINLDHLVADFNTRLHLGPPSKKQHSNITTSWCAGRVTIPSPAPLPAIIRPTQVHMSPSTKVKATCASFLFGSTTSWSNPLYQINTTPFLHDPSGASTRRKVAHLPRRTPKNPSLSHRRINGSTNDNGHHSSLSPSRDPSYTSDVSSGRTPSSSSSDTSSSGPPTPVLAQNTSLESLPLPLVIIQDSDSSDILSDGFFLPVQETSLDPSSVIVPKQPVFETPSASHRQIRGLPRRSIA